MTKAKQPSREHHQKPHMNQNGSWIVGVITAKKDDGVFWTAPDDSDIVIWFPPKADPMNIGTQPVKAGQTFSANVPAGKAGTYPYSIFIYKDCSMVEGGSSPVMIIE